jgi:hypothetical protein
MRRPVMLPAMDDKRMGGSTPDSDSWIFWPTVEQPRLAATRGAVCRSSGAPFGEHRSSQAALRLPLDAPSAPATIDRSMTTKTQGPPRMTTNILDVHFAWPNPGPNWRGPTKSGIIKAYDAVIHVVRPCMIRQKRNTLRYWDVMTVLDRGEVFRAKGQPESMAWGVATELTLAIRDDRLNDGCLLELGEMELINNARSRIDWRRADDSSTEARQGIGGPVDVKGRILKPASGVYRRLELAMPDQKGDASGINWLDVMLTAVLVHLKADLEMYLETDFLPVRVCERRACRSFFRVHRMAGRHQFCSDTCRACAAREQ